MAANNAEILIRNTQSVCPTCIKPVPARVVEIEGRVELHKECAEHGAFQVLLSNHAWYWRELNDFYFKLIPESFPQRDYIIRLTDRCNLDCPICLASANKRPVPDLPAEELQRFLGRRKRVKVDLMGAEPTVRDDLIEVVRAVSRSGNFPALHTNGIKLADRDYLRRLVEAGMTEVHLQFDGFDDGTYARIRGRELMETKRQALKNLEEFNVATDLVVTVLRNDNEAQIKKVLDYSAEHDFVREVFYLGCRMLGSATGTHDQQCLVPDEVMDFFLEQMEGRITRRHLFIFQKLYFTFLHLFRVRKCLYIHHYLMVRTKDGAAPLNEIIDLERIEPVLDRYAEEAALRPWRARARLLVSLTKAFHTRRAFAFLKDSLRIKLLLLLGFDLSKIPPKTILLGWITACDPLIFDTQVAKNCGKGEISMDLGPHDSGAWANVLRERLVQMREQP